MTLRDLDGIVVTQGPGLVGSLLVGVQAAKALAWVHGAPLCGVNHLEGHIYAAFLEGNPPDYPFLALVVSGGHTALYLAREPRGYARIGRTRDDAAGEAFDKVAKLLGLGYPGGPAIERIAREGNPAALRLPTAQMTDGAPDFSFSGIKTAVSLHVRRAGALSPAHVADVAASFQATVVKMLVRKTVRAGLSRGARRVLGRTLKEVFAPETSLVRHLTDTLATGESRSESSAVVEGLDGRPVHVSVVTAPLAGRSGAVISAVAVVRDISRLRQLEAEVRRGETLAAAGQMAIGLAHEIRNPLSAIRGAAQLMQRELGDEARWGEYTSVLLKEVTRVNSIIEMLLDVGRPVTLRAVPLNVHQLLERVALLLEGEAASRRITFVRRYDPSLPPILADEDRIMQVFHNLVRNAIEAMPGGGRLTLVTRLSMNPP